MKFCGQGASGLINDVNQPLLRTSFLAARDATGLSIAQQGGGIKNKKILRRHPLCMNAQIPYCISHHSAVLASATVVFIPLPDKTL